CFFVSSSSTIAVNQPANTHTVFTTFSLGTLTRMNSGTVLFRGMGNTGAAITSSGTLVGGGGAAGSTSVSILPYAIGDRTTSGEGTDFVTIDGGFIRPL